MYHWTNSSSFSILKVSQSNFTCFFTFFSCFFFVFFTCLFFTLLGDLLKSCRSLLYTEGTSISMPFPLIETTVSLLNLHLITRNVPFPVDSIRNIEEVWHVDQMKPKKWPNHKFCVLASQVRSCPMIGSFRPQRKECCPWFGWICRRPSAS